MKYAIFVLLAVLVVFAACEAQVEAETELEAETSQETEEEQTQDTTQEVVDEVLGTVDDAREELLAFFDRQEGLRYSVDYTITAQGQAATMSQYVDTNGVRVRVDTQAQGVETRVIIDNDEVYSCMNMGSWSCFDATNDDMPDTTSTDARDEFMADSSIEVTRVADRTVAGTSTQCYVFDTGDGASEQCFSPEGVPLYIETTAEGQASVLQATSYSLSIPNNAFELPAAPGSMNDFGGGFDASAWGY